MKTERIMKQWKTYFRSFSVGLEPATRACEAVIVIHSTIEVYFGNEAQKVSHHLARVCNPIWYWTHVIELWELREVVGTRTIRRMLIFV